MLVFVLLPPEQQTKDRTHHYSHIECDVEGCDVRSPPAIELLHGKSLFERGWYIDGGEHRCPEHFHDETPRRGPQYRDA